MTTAITPETPETLIQIIAYWKKIITTKWENGVHVWPPAESSLYRIRQLLDNEELQKEVFADLNPSLILVDGYEQSTVTFEELEKQIQQSLGFDNEKSFNLNDWIGKLKKPTVFFIRGLDTALRSGNIQPLQKLASLPNRFTNPYLKIILFTELNLPESPLFSQLLQTDNFLQNIAYQRLFEEKDIIQFSNYIAYEWQLTLPQKILSTFVRDIGGHFLLVKEGIRLFRDNPTITKENLLNTPSLKRKGLAIFQKLSEADKEIVLAILRGNTTVKSSEYLTQTALVTNNAVGLPYWLYIKSEILQSNPQYTSSPSLDFLFTTIERDIFEFLKDSGKIITREEIAEKIWHKNWEDKYSDWAIDQLIHRIREKLKQANTSYEIVTKKGEGFYLKKLG